MSEAKPETAEEIREFLLEVAQNAADRWGEVRERSWTEVLWRFGNDIAAVVAQNLEVRVVPMCRPPEGAPPA